MFLSKVINSAYVSKVRKVRRETKNFLYTFFSFHVFFVAHVDALIQLIIKKSLLPNPVTELMSFLWFVLLFCRF